MSTNKAFKQAVGGSHIQLNARRYAHDFVAGKTDVIYVVDFYDGKSLVCALVPGTERNQKIFQGLRADHIKGVHEHDFPQYLFVRNKELFTKQGKPVEIITVQGKTILMIPPHFICAFGIDIGEQVIHYERGGVHDDERQYRFVKNRLEIFAPVPA